MVTGCYETLAWCKNSTWRTHETAFWCCCLKLKQESKHLVQLFSNNDKKLINVKKSNKKQIKRKAQTLASP